MLEYGCSVLSVVHELCGYVCNQFPRNFIIWFLRVPRALAFVVIWYLMQGGHFVAGREGRPITAGTPL